MDSKLKCVFVMPENSSNSGGAGGAVSNGAEKSSEKPDSHNSIPSSVPTKPSSPKVIISSCVNELHWKWFFEFTAVHCGLRGYEMF